MPSPWRVITPNPYWAAGCESAAEIVSVLRHIARDIRHTYPDTGYEPGDSRRDGTFRKVSVVVRAPDGRRLNVQTRTGYLAGRSAGVQ